MNRVILMGRLTKEPDTRFLAQTNNTICKFSIAVNRKFSKPGEEKVADFFNIVTFGKLAEFCGKYFLKGMQVVVSGRLQNSTWDDQQGVKHYFTDIVADEAYFAEGKKNQNPGSSEGQQAQWSPGSAEGQQAQWSAGSAEKSPPDNKEASGDGYFPMDDDDQLPF